MLSVYLGELEQVIYHPPTYFDNQYEDEWITDPLSVEMIHTGCRQIGSRKRASDRKPCSWSCFCKGNLRRSEDIDLNGIRSVRKDF